MKEIFKNCLEYHLGHIDIDDKYEVFPQAVASIEKTIERRFGFQKLGEIVSKEIKY